MNKLARMQKTLHTQLRSSGISHNFEHSQASPGASLLSDLRDTIHKINARQPGKKIAGICDPAQAKKKIVGHL